MNPNDFVETGLSISMCTKQVSDGFKEGESVVISKKIDLQSLPFGTITALTQRKTR